MQSLENRLIVHLNTTRPVPALQSLSLGFALTTDLQSYSVLQGAAIVIEKLGEGSWWIQILIIGGAIGAIADAAPKLIEEIRTSTGTFAPMAASVLDQHYGTDCQVTTDAIDVVISRKHMNAAKAANLAEPTLAEKLASGSRYTNPNPITVTVVGILFRDSDGRTWLNSGDKSILVSSLVPRPPGRAYVVTGFVRWLDPPTFEAQRCEFVTDDEGNTNVDLKLLATPPTFRSVGLDTHDWPSPE